MVSEIGVGDDSHNPSGLAPYWTSRKSRGFWPRSDCSGRAELKASANLPVQVAGAAGVTHDSAAKDHRRIAPSDAESCSL
ncbi:hypothetical protein PLANPX_3609 [Lacipirellula parvula]|uniref:Uncharacterized protein n=1 Tax=Lacipirellula parvula TaxID=2650471 RepID=A0A5K7XD98_9BACT|nr:hypothetical protein PLANPX_3609 [Lacipirellula parvula]